MIVLIGLLSLARRITAHHTFLLLEFKVELAWYRLQFTVETCKPGNFSDHFYLLGLVLH